LIPLINVKGGIATFNTEIYDSISEYTRIFCLKWQKKREIWS